MGKTLENIVMGVAGTVIVGGTAAATLSAAGATAVGGYLSVRAAQGGDAVVLMYCTLGALVFGYATWKIGSQIPAMIRTFTGRENYEAMK